MATSGTERGYPDLARVPGLPGCRRRVAPAAVRRLRRSPTPSWRPVWGPRSSWPPPPSTCTCGHPGRDTVLYPGRVVSDLRHGRAAGRVPSRAGGRTARRRAGPRLHRRARRGPGPGAVDQLPVQPVRPADRPGRGGRLGPRARGPGVLRRVLRRVHLGRSAPVGAASPGPTAWWPCTRCPSARTWPGSGPASTPVIAELVGYLLDVRRHAGLMVPGPGAGRGRGGLRRRRPRGRPAPALPGPAGVPGRGVSPPSACRCRLPAGGFYLWVPVPESMSGSGSGLSGGWSVTEALALDGRAAGQPGRALRPDGSGFVRVAVVQPMERLSVGGRAAGRSPDPGDAARSDAPVRLSPIRRVVCRSGSGGIRSTGRDGQG